MFAGTSRGPSCYIIIINWLTPYYLPLYSIGASSFEGPLSSWTTSSLIEMDQMFWEASSFSSDLNFDISRIKNLSLVFTNASAFNGDISGWDTSGVEDLFHTFSNASSFNSDISNWTTSAVKSLWGTFENAVSFNVDLSDWNTSAVVDFESVSKMLGCRSLCYPLECPANFFYLALRSAFKEQQSTILP